MIGFFKSRIPKVACLTVSETGLVRKDNQDAAFVDAAKTVFCVADGMGGGSEGGTASRFVCEEVAKATDAQTLVARMEAVDAAIRAANKRIRAYAQERGFAQMGSTVAVLLVDPENSRRGAVCHVGDSRIYRVRRGNVEQLTKDHTVGGQLSELVGGAQAIGLRSRANPLAHVLTRAIGMEGCVLGDWRKVDISEGDAFLVCSDGVHDVVSDSLIGELLTAEPEPATAADRLRDEVVRNGAPDNFTYIVIRMRGE